MALVLSINVREYIDSINVQDATGIYDATNNPYGYGAPNGTIAGATSATLTFTMPDATVVVINAYPSLPINDKSYYEVTLADLGVDFIESGYWTILYTVVISGTTYTATCTCLFTKNAQCCVDKRQLKITPDNAGDSFSIETLTLNNMIEAAKAADDQSLTDFATNTIEYVKTKCEGCCCC